MPHAPLARPEESILVVIDMQERMISALTDGAATVAAVGRMIRAARLLGVPILWTEQYPDGLGPTAAALRTLFPPDARPIVKCTCSCWRDSRFKESLIGAQRESVLLVGAETHVCVQQTALDLLQVDYTPFVLADATASRRTVDREISFKRMRDAGVVVTSVESMMFELVARCDDPRFRDIVRLVKEQPPDTQGRDAPTSDKSPRASV